MAKKDKKNPLEEFEMVPTNEAEESEAEFVSDIDFWQEVLTQYGKIESPTHLKLLLKKLETETARENAKLAKKQRLVAQRNQAAKKKAAERKKAEKRAMAALPAAKRAAMMQQQNELAAQAKADEAQAKLDAKEALKKAKADEQAQKIVDAEFKMQERLFILSLTPDEKSEYMFLRKAKTRIDAAEAKLNQAKEKESDVVHSTTMPVEGFLKVLGICVAATAVITFCATNIVLDTGYYDEKVSVLKAGLADFESKLDGSPVEAASDLEGGLSVYNQILGNMPVVEDQLAMLNQTYFWVLNKETSESLGISEVSEQAAALQTSIDALQAVVDANTAFTTEIDDAYQSETDITALQTKLNDYNQQIEQLIVSYDALELPTGLPEFKAAYREKIVANQTYIQLMIAYLDKLMAIREQLNGKEDTITKAQNISLQSSDTLEEKVDDYLGKMSDVVNVHKSLTALNNDITYAQIIGKKGFAFVAGGTLSDSAISFYLSMVELKDIIKESNKVEQKCLDLPYPLVEKETNETILTHRSQGTTDTALENNQALETRIAAVTVPDALTASVRVYTRGLASRTEFLKLQKQYIDLSTEKDGKFGAYDEAKTAYDTAQYNASAERSENGKTTLYYTLVDQRDAAKKTMDEAEAAAEKEADTIQEQMKEIREDAIALKTEFESDLDF